MNMKVRAAREGVLCDGPPLAGVPTVPARMAGSPILAAGEPRTSAVYVRVSSAGQKDDLGRQVAPVTTWAVSHGLVVTKAGSALNERRRKLQGLLRYEALTVIVRAAASRDRRAVEAVTGPAGGDAVP